MFAAKQGFWASSLDGIITGPSGIGFGRSIKFDYTGQYMAIGSFTNTNAATVNIYTRGSTSNGWTLQTAIPNPGGIPYWGLNIDMDGTGQNVILSDINTPAIRRFTRTGTTWTPTTIVGGSPNFSATLSISGDATLIATSSTYGDGVYFFDGSNTFLYKSTMVPNGFTNQRFDQTGTYMLGEDGFVVTAADYRADIFVRSGSTWTLSSNVRTLVAPDPIGLPQGLGSPTCFTGINYTGDWAIVGCPSANGTLGRVHVLQRTGATWAIQASLVSPTPLAGEQFGYSVAINGAGDRVAIGTNRNTLSGTYAPVYVFDRVGTTWTNTALLQKPNTTIGKFGHAVAMGQISGGQNYVGVTDPDTGTIYVFRYTGTTWTLANA